jgi:hypothetical protein
VTRRLTRLRRLIGLGAPEITVRNDWRMLREAVDGLIAHESRGGQLTDARRHAWMELVGAPELQNPPRPIEDEVDDDDLILLPGRATGIRLLDGIAHQPQKTPAVLWMRLERLGASRKLRRRLVHTLSRARVVSRRRWLRRGFAVRQEALAAAVDSLRRDLLGDPGEPERRAMVGLARHQKLK